MSLPSSDGRSYGKHYPEKYDSGSKYSSKYPKEQRRKFLSYQDRAHAVHA